MKTSLLGVVCAFAITILFLTETSTAATINPTNIYVTGDSDGAFFTGDTVTVTWDNSAYGDNNSGIISVLMDLSDFGSGGLTPAIDTGSGCDIAVDGIWCAAYTILAGDGPFLNAVAAVTVVDSLGTTGPVADDETFRINAVPVPPAVWLFGSGLIGLIRVAKRKNA